MRINILLAALAIPWALAAQSNAVKIAPDCYVEFNLTAAGSSPNVPNRLTGCKKWLVTFNNYGFSGLTMTFQSAPAGASEGPGTWVTFAGTTDTGSNPSTATTYAEPTFSGYYPFTRVTLSSTTGTGVVSGSISGWKRDSASAGSGVTTLAGTANQIAVDAATGAVTISIPTNPTLPGTTTGTFSGNLTGTASLATALAANPADCAAGTVAITIAASGALTCTTQYFFQGADAGGDDTYVLAPTNFPAAYVDGTVVTIAVTTGNTGAATLDCGPGAKAIKLTDGTTDPTTGDIPALSIQRLRYDAAGNAAAGAWILSL